MKLASVCSGIGAPELAFKSLGWEPIWYSEIAKFPSAVMAHHYPVVPNLGDMTTLHKNEIFQDEPVDLIIGGTPCQSFSNAGLRKGLADPRGNLMLVYLSILNQIRPRWMVWENVPGVLSTNQGRDFGTFIGGLGQIGYGFAYRVLDAQYYGVAQRRRRVFVVGCFGDWRAAAAVLFERESLCGYPAPSRKTGQRVAETLTGGTGQCSGQEYKNEGYLQVASTLSRGLGMRGSVSSEDAVGGHLQVMATGQANAEISTCGGTPSITCNHEVPIVCFDSKASSGFAPSPSRVRRLTPRECERLQGFPDDFTLIPWRKGQSPDGPRYAALGNSMAVPVVRWIGERIDAVEKETI